MTKYKRLMLRRIKWVDQDDVEMANSSGSEDMAQESADLKCHLVWEGATNVPQFGDKFRAFYGVKNETEGRRVFSEKTQYLWESIVNF